MKKQKTGTVSHLYLFLIFIIACAFLLVFPQNAGAEETDNSQSVTVTLHAGDNGYFDNDPEKKDKESVQTIGEAFATDSDPAPVNDVSVFLGWADSPDSAAAGIIPGSTIVDEDFPTELYAVWEEKVLVTYEATDGYFINDGVMAGQLARSYPIGSNFDETVKPENFSDQLMFGGWYSRTKGKGEKYTKETVLDQVSYQVFAYWQLDMSMIKELETDKEYDLELESGTRYYSFTPDETAVYELVTWDVVTEGVQAYLTLLDQDQNVIASGIKTDMDGNSSLSHELTAGTTYIFGLAEYSIQPITFHFKIHRPETGFVNFHANLPGQAWFDDDPDKNVKQIEIMKGNDIHMFTRSGLKVDPSALYSFMGWSRDPDAEAVDEELIVDGDIDVYAVYGELVSVEFDANGGTFQDGEDKIELRMSPDSPFSFDYPDPKIDDESRRFSGWAASASAEEPDIDEFLITCSELPPVIYAVYGDAITVTFDADGGYFYFDPSITVQQFIRGKGHIFYGMTVNHEDPEYSYLGWKDQFGNETLRTTGSADPNFRIYEDTIFKPIWVRKIIVEGNGGYFMWDREQTALGVWLRTDKPFSNQSLLDMDVYPVLDDALSYFAGWATDPEAEEPDITEGEAEITKIPHRIYAVWKEDTYYLDQGEGSSWEKGSEEGLEFIVKRAGDDTETFRTFSGIRIDGAEVPAAEAFKATDKNDKSLYLTFKPSYLETLEAGSHALTFIFNNNMSREVTVSAEFTVREKTIEVKSIELNRTEAEVAAKKTLQLKAAVSPEDATDKTVTWTSSNESVAAVDENGLVTAKAYGKVTITATTANNLSASCEIQTRFYDVRNSGRFYFDPVYWAVENKITKCTVKFRPDDVVNRGELTAFLYRLEGSPEVTKITTKFKDVNQDTKFAKEITWAVNEGIIEGYSNGTFRPADNITRAQAAIMIWRYAGSPEVTAKKSPFKDLKVSGSETFRAAVWGKQNGIIYGSQGQFLPKNTCTRGEVMTFLFRYNNM